MIRFVITRFNDLDRPELQALLPLTNSLERGDLRDGSSRESGSTFRQLLHDRLRFHPGPNDRWAVVGHDGERPAGWCLVTRINEDPETCEALVAPTASVGFYVAPTHRRQGLAAGLLREALELARRVGLHQLLGQPWNSGSLSFFLSRGFEERTPFHTGWSNGVAVLSIRSEEL